MKFSGIHQSVLVAVTAIALTASLGCNKKTPQAEAPAAAEVKPEGDAAPAGNSEAAASITAARTDLNAGRVDDAAAKLAGLQMQGATFNTQQAKDYRQAMSDAYDKAIELAQKGDPRAQAALQLLRSAGPK